MGGYCAGPLDSPGIRADKTANTIAAALLHGYVTVSAGVRGRNSVDDQGNYLGAAPAVLCDMKAAVRYLRYNRERIPGNTDRIITTGRAVCMDRPDSRRWSVVMSELPEGNRTGSRHIQRIYVVGHRNADRIIAIGNRRGS